jgi:hypothetical protein
MKNNNFNFEGFKPSYKKDFFTYPLVLEGVWKYLSGSENTVLTFILRMTLGFQKTSDKITLNQIKNGVGKSNLGTGVSISQIRRALAELEKRGIIEIKRKYHAPSTICLVLEKEIDMNEVNQSENDSNNNEITYLINKFSTVSPHRVNDFLKDKKQINAIKILIDAYGIEMIENAITNLEYTNKIKFAPVISSPRDLSEKFENLLSFFYRKKEETKSDFKLQF